MSTARTQELLDTEKPTFERLASMTELTGYTHPATPDVEDLSIAAEAKPRRRCLDYFHPRRLGFYTEFSILKKILLFFCGVLAGYEAFQPSERAANKITTLIINDDDFRNNLNMSIAALAAVISAICTWKGVGYSVRNMGLFSDRMDQHGKIIVELKSSNQTLKERVTFLESLHEPEVKARNAQAPSTLSSIFSFGVFQGNNSDTIDESEGPVIEVIDDGKKDEKSAQRPNRSSTLTRKLP